MLEQEFESKKRLLLSKLQDYLIKKSVNTEANFSCLNPNDKSHLPSMTYNPKNYTVECFNCGVSYNLFDLIGIDFNLTDFPHQFIKAYEMYIGKVPLGFIDVLKQQNNSAEEPPKESRPVFEIASDFSAKEPLIPFGSNDADSNSYTNKENIAASQRGFNNISPFEEAKLRPFDVNKITPSNISASLSETDNHRIQQFQNINNINISRNNLNQNLNASSPFSLKDIGQSNNHRFGESQSNSFGGFNSSEIAYNFSDYINQCSSNVDKTSYFKDRGLSETVIRRFKLGFDEQFQFEIDNLSGKPKFWKAAIIPYGNHGYCVRNTDLEANSKNERYKKKGYFDIYNHEVLNQKGDIFITEGEFDALSLETLGYRALGLGGASNIRMLIEAINNCSEEHTYYVCLDNDEAGIEASNEICKFLEQKNLRYRRLNLAHPYKDINEALYSARNVLEDRLSNIEKILSYKFGAIEKKEPYKYVLSKEALFSFNLSKALYTVCSKPQILRKFVSEAIRAKRGAILLASDRVQKDYISSLAIENKTDSYSEDAFGLVKFLEIDSDDVPLQLSEGIMAHSIQSSTNYTVILDLSSYPCSQAIMILKRIANKMLDFMVPVLALCNEKDSSYIEAVSVQNLNLEMTENGDLLCKTNDQSCYPVTFRLNSVL
ncbi:MAG: toprim domain-containing protein [Succinivibrio sp.]